ncbi:SRPBCC family protein [Pseudoalteromonas tetraodonis]|uniref:SRPBCC family protein n=1 Tax=Pseudoalteromonas tetraodonis TaxID=43659 RepID=UPI003735A59B
MQFSIILLLVFVVVGLLLPQNYHVQKSIKINARAPVIKSLVEDFTQWYKWSPWQQIDPNIKFNIGEPSSGAGAYQSWEGKWGKGEMTISALSDNEVVFSVLFNQEHIITSKLLFSPHTKTVTWQIEGQATMPLISGYVAIFAENILGNIVTLGLNNLKTVAQLSDAQAIMESHDSQNRTSQD